MYVNVLETWRDSKQTTLQVHLCLTILLSHCFLPCLLLPSDYLQNAKPQGKIFTSFIFFNPTNFISNKVTCKKYVSIICMSSLLCALWLLHKNSKPKWWLDSNLIQGESQVKSANKTTKQKIRFSQREWNRQRESNQRQVDRWSKTTRVYHLVTHANFPCVRFILFIFWLVLKYNPLVFSWSLYWALCEFSHCIEFSSPLIFNLNSNSSHPSQKIVNSCFRRKKYKRQVEPIAIVGGLKRNEYTQLTIYYTHFFPLFYPTKIFILAFVVLFFQLIRLISLKIKLC